MNATLKVRPGFTGATAATAEIDAARNEYEAFQIVVQGGASGIPDVTATATGLPNVRLYRVGLYNIEWASNVEGAPGEWPDPLIPDVDAYDGQQRNAFPMAVPPNSARAIWVEVHVPRDMPPGIVTGDVHVTGTGLDAHVPVHLRVRGFTLPDTASLKSSFGFSVDLCCRAHDGTSYCNSNAQAEPWVRKYTQAALEHRISFYSPYYTMPTNNDWSYFDSLDGPLLDGRLTTIKSGSRDATFMSQEKAHFDAHGWTGKLYDYTCDEPPATCAWSDIPVRAAAVHAAGLRTQVTTSIDRASANLPNWMDVLDIITPIINEMEDSSGSQRPRYDDFLAQGPGKELWWYQSCESHGCGGCNAGMANDSTHGYPSYVIDASALQNRAMEWLSYEFDIGGELYYETVQSLDQAWNSYTDPTGALCAFGGSGDGTLFYPGTPDRIGGTTGIPIESQRLKMVREGMEDYEYLHLCDQLGDSATAKNEASQLFPHVYDVTSTTPEQLYAARARLADRIEQLLGVPRPSLQVPRAPGPVDITGDLHEFAAAPTVQVTAGGAQATFQLLWDDQFLYVAANVADPDVRVGATGHDGELWNADAIEVMLDPAHDRSAAPDADDRHVIVTAQGDTRDAQGAGSTENAAFDFPSFAPHAMAATGGWRAAMAIPWSQLPVGQPIAAGLTMGADLALDNLDASGLTYADWAGIMPFAQPARWNDLQLVDVAGPGDGVGGGPHPGSAATAMDSGCQMGPGAPGGAITLFLLALARLRGSARRRSPRCPGAAAARPPRGRLGTPRR